jgi:fructose-specific phosphotransferase system IIC component
MDANREASLKLAVVSAYAEMSLAEKAILSAGAVPLSVGTALSKAGFSKNEYGPALKLAGGVA